MTIPPTSQHGIAIIGMSTGGLNILDSLFGEMPRLNASIILIQHMPKGINDYVCEAITSLTSMQVRLAESNDLLQEGTLYIAPSKLHLKIVNNRMIQLFEGERVNFVCPSIDVTMLSLVERPGQIVVGAVMTGMGKDGAAGISHIKRIGGTTIAQDEASSIIYGMPKSACETGDVDVVLSPQKVRKKLIDIFGILEQ